MFKLKGNSFYGKMIEDLINHLKTTFTIIEELVDKSFTSPFFEGLEEINITFEIKECKRQVTIMRLYQCGIAVYQLVKLHMLEFYHDFLDKYLDWREFELIQIDTDSMYMAILGEFDEIVKLELQEKMTKKGKPSFCRLQSTMTELRDCL